MKVQKWFESSDSLVYLDTSNSKLPFLVKRIISYLASKFDRLSMIGRYVFPRFSGLKEVSSSSGDLLMVLSFLSNVLLLACTPQGSFLLVCTPQFQTTGAPAIFQHPPSTSLIGLRLYCVTCSVLASA